MSNTQLQLDSLKKKNFSPFVSLSSESASSCAPERLGRKGGAGKRWLGSEDGDGKGSVEVTSSPVSELFRTDSLYISRVTLPKAAL